jgi:hypothetical protein
MDGSVTRLPPKPHLRLAHSGLSPAERLLRAHKIVEQAGAELQMDEMGDGVALLCHAAATHLGLVMGPERAAVVFEQCADEVRRLPIPPRPPYPPRHP